MKSWESCRKYELFCFRESRYVLWSKESNVSPGSCPLVWNNGLAKCSCSTHLTFSEMAAQNNATACLLFPILRRPFAKFVDSPYYSESELFRQDQWRLLHNVTLILRIWFQQITNLLLNHALITYNASNVLTT